MLTPQRPIDIVLTTNVKDVEHILRDPYTYEKGYDQVSFDFRPNHLPNTNSHCSFFIKASREHRSCGY
jgi:hypothetical protein